MGIEVRQFANSSKKLWPLVGPWVTSRAVHKELGGPVLTGDDTTWFVAVVDSKPVGFLLLRKADSVWWRDAAFVVESERGKGVHKQLILASTTVSSQDKLPVRIVCRSARWKHYAKSGFTKLGQRGDWITGEKA